MKEIKLNPSMVSYIKANILPQYDRNDEGHGINHINYVIDRSLKFAEQFENINYNMVYTIAAYHDIAHSVDKRKHEILSAEMFYENMDMNVFFSEDERILIKEAIEDHRASADFVPRSIYGKIVSSADRSTNVKDFFQRTHAYTLKHFPDFSKKEMIARAYEHAMKKYGEEGYAKHYVNDAEYKRFRDTINFLINNRDMFNRFYEECNNVNTERGTFD